MTTLLALLDSITIGTDTEALVTVILVIVIVLLLIEVVRRVRRP